MQLEGAAIRNIFTLCTEVREGSNTKNKERLKVNIPHYQRPYTWKSEQIENLIDDFYKYNNNSSSDSNYFTGSIVAVNKDGVYDIVDGQQRITTVYLVSYLKFLIQRAYTEEIIKTQIPTEIIDNIEDLKKIYNDLIGEFLFLEDFKSKVKDIEKISRLTENELKEKFNSVYPDFFDATENISDLSEQIEVKEFEKFRKYYRKELGLPILKDFKKDYPKEHRETTFDFLEKENLSLKYSRDSLNDNLKDALSRVCIELSDTNSIEIKIVEKETASKNNNLEEDIVNKYIKSIELMFNKFKEYSKMENENHLQNAAEIVERINLFLEKLQFCVVVTCNHNDAYTLFEVLNDRALAVSDLELVKNLFYRTYVLKSKDLDKDIDKNLSILESQWSDDIFGNSIALSSKAMISYLGTVFITGKSSIDDKHASNYRKEIESEYLEKVNEYGFKDIQKDFNIFQAVKVILDKSEIRYKSKRQNALEVESSEEKSDIIKAIHLTHALGQSGVMSALINIILKVFMEENNQKDEFDLEKFEEFFKELIRKKNDSKERVYERINSLAYDLSKAVLLYENHISPRKFAKKIIESVNYKKYNFENCIGESSKYKEEMEKEFTDWTNKWYFGNNKDRNFKLKVLFLKLYKTEKTGEKLKLSRTPINLIKDSLELEHLEPKKINKSNKEKYFMYDQEENRGEYVDKLGNMLLAYKKENIKKDNVPLFKGLKSYGEMGVRDHWLIKEIEEMLKEEVEYGERKYSKLDVSGDPIPNENFFIERKRRLQEYFKSVLDLNV